MTNGNGHKQKNANDVLIVGAARTPQGKFLGALQPLTAPELGKHVLKAVVERSRINPAEVDEVILGQVVAAGSGQAVARQAWLGAGYPDRVGGLMVNKACGSGMKAIMLSANAIRAGD